MKKLLSVFLLIAAVPYTSFAEFKSIDAGANYPIVQGDRYSTMQTKIGYELQTLAHTDTFQDFKPLKWMGMFDMKFSAFYQPYSVFGKDDVNLNMLGLLAGFETRGTQHNFVLQPFMSLQVGVIYDWLAFAEKTAATNSQFHQLTRAAFGFEAPIWKSLSLVVETPITMIMRQSDPIIVMNANALARWRFE